MYSNKYNDSRDSEDCRNRGDKFRSITNGSELFSGSSSKIRVMKLKGYSEMKATNNLAIIFEATTRKRPMKIRKNNFCTIKQVFATALTIAFSIVLVSDLSRIVKMSTNDASSLGSSFPASSGPKLTAWASWIGEVPTAAELYGDAASEMPTTESFDDDDEDEELDASASNEYPDNENEADESYEDPDEAEQESEQESRVNEDWLEPPNNHQESYSKGRDLTTTKTTTKQRNKRDIEDAISLASLRRRQAAERRKEADEYNVDDGDEDAWIHDGVDDIQIDPETKKAASELTFDEKSIDAEYDPHQMKADENKIVNKTRITTISEVIPMNVPTDFGDGPMEDKDFTGDKDSTRINSQYLPPPPTTMTMTTPSTTATIPTILTAGHLLPASHLSLDQAQQLVAQQAEPHFWSSASNVRTNSKISLPASPPDGLNKIDKFERDELYGGDTQVDGATRGWENSIHHSREDDDP